MFLELGTIRSIAKAISWLNSFSDAEIKHVKKETSELLTDLSKSLLNLYDVTEQVTQLSERLPKSAKSFAQEFQKVHAYCRRFYFDQSNISAARTHCGDVEREVEKIKFKLSKILRTDIGKWKEADEKLRDIIGQDGLLLAGYDKSVAKLDRAMREIAGLLKKGKNTEARNKFSKLGASLQDDLRTLKQGMDQMRQAADHIHAIVS